MEIRKTLIGAFLATFLIGCFFVLPRKKVSEAVVGNIESSEAISLSSEKLTSAKSDVISYVTAKHFGGSELLDGDYYDQNHEYKFDMLETGGFHGEEVGAESGETWLGFFAAGSQAFLRNTKIEVRRVHDEIVDDEGQKTGKKVSVKSTNQPVFLLKNADSLGEGRIQTLFRGTFYNEMAREEGEPAEIRKGFVQTYEIGGENYTLRVVKVFNKQANVRFALILESAKTKQILHTVEGEGYLGTLYWVGDLDRDGKPDLFLSPWIRENNSESSLFISSEAKGKNLVKKVAAFWTQGC